MEGSQLPPLTRCQILMLELSSFSVSGMGTCPLRPECTTNADLGHVIGVPMMMEVRSNNIQWTTRQALGNSSA